VVAMPMDAGRWHEPGQAVEQFEGREAKHLATVHIGLGEPLDQASLRRGERLESGRGVTAVGPLYRCYRIASGATRLAQDAPFFFLAGPSASSTPFQ